VRALSRHPVLEMLGEQFRAALLENVRDVSGVYFQVFHRQFDASHRRSRFLSVSARYSSPTSSESFGEHDVAFVFVSSDR